ncbi:hypothetical protein SKAU_G00223890 [Synaphobranchus kaupii]|uniref:EF-hand domain-containing protein n=1 Tax=Synaphobranchus kaupii TaxID=118154 RepID=A0A9Q1FBK0_SYNKA|nr:hypothetical protein SKAU_G00223890 [Synaphobranchus kaupii]
MGSLGGTLHITKPTVTEKNMSEVQKAMTGLIATFHKYSGKEGDKFTLSKGELKDLLNNEMGDIFGKASDKAAIDKIFKDLDANKDNSVDFQEYITLVACLTMKHAKKIRIRKFTGEMKEREKEELNLSRGRNGRSGIHSIKCVSHPSAFTLSLLLSFTPSNITITMDQMSAIQSGMSLIIAAFHKYSEKEGNKYTLSKSELKDLLNNEMGDIFGKASDKGEIDKIFEGLDVNKDGSVDFQEYMNMITVITMLCNEFFMDDNPSK